MLDRVSRSRRHLVVTLHSMRENHTPLERETLSSIPVEHPTHSLRSDLNA